MQIKNYNVVKTIYYNSRTIVYEAISPDGDIVAIKTVRDNTDHNYVNKLYREFTIGKNLNSRYSSHYIELIEDDKVYLVKSFEPGKTLAEIIPPAGMHIDTFLPYALSIAETLEYIHTNNILHLDLNPNNILCNLNDKSVKLLDFGESISNLTVHKSLKKNIQITGGAAYSSPEQTGLSNKNIDTRSDLYSIGVIFYIMLSGQLPFQGENNIQIAHSHLAKIAQELKEINPDIPPTLSLIVKKLLAKEKDERYQSAFSLKYDLEKFRLDSKNEFALGSQDISDKLVIPQKLYGRDKELLSVQEKIGSIIGNIPKLMMISGYSGIGKSSFINELSPAILSQNGYFLKGKFDQYNRTTSYIAFIQIFINLINIINTMPPDIKRKTIQDLSNFLGESKNALVKIVPELKTLFNIAHTPAIEQSRLKNQLFIAMERFLSFFASKEHPLVIFIDDMQWADLASLEILELIFSSNRLNSFLIIGAYRSNEVNSTHPMRLSLNTIGDKIGKIEEIELLPLTLDAIKQLLSETLKTQEVNALGELLLQKTEGNPFFVRQFIHTLGKRDLLRFNKESRSWEWEIAKIREEDLTSNVIDHLVAKINTMSSNARIFIQTASVIGDIFDLNALSSLYLFADTDILEILDEVLNEGLIDVFSDDNVIVSYPSQYYHFIHDKIRQAAYLMLDEHTKKELHLKLVHDFLSHENRTEKNALTVAKHIVEVIDSIKQYELYPILDILNQASLSAKEALAYDEAITYSRRALSVLPDDAWNERYETTFSLYLNLLDTLSHARKFEEAAELFEYLLQNNLLRAIDIARIYNHRLAYHFMQGMLAEAIEDGRQALEVLGHHIPDNPSALSVLEANELNWFRTHIQSAEELHELKEMNDEVIELCMDILVNMGIPAFVSRQDMFAVVAFKMARLSLIYGNCDVSSYGYMLCGMIIGSRLREYENGYAYGQFAMVLQDKFNNKAIECKLLRVYGAYVASWMQPHEQTLNILYKAYMSGIETGDFLYSIYCVNHIFTREFLSGIALDVLEEKSKSYLDFIKSSKELPILMTQYLLINIPRCLRGNTDSLSSLSTPDFNENEAVEYFKAINYKTLLAYYYIYKLQICYIHELYDEALGYARDAVEYLGNIKGNILETEWVFYYSMSLFRYSLSNTINDGERQTLRDFEKQFEQWALLCPENFQPKYLLIKGINAYILSHFEEAFADFDQAIEAQDHNTPTLFKALSLELTGICWKSRNNRRIAKTYLQEAYTIYYEMKALSKAKLLFNMQSALLHSEKSFHLASTPSSQNANDLNIFDEETILKATQLISGKVNRSELIEKFTHIIAQSFGIQLGGLILKDNNGALYLEGFFNINNEPKIVIEHQRLKFSKLIPKSIINEVLTHNQVLIVDDAINDIRFALDPIVLERSIISVICAPIILKEELIGLIYMENNLIKGFFDNTREKVLNILLTQTAVTLELETLYSHDKLTGALSRQKLDEVLSQNDFYALLLVNINNLDSVNSTYGYAIGDEILKLFVHFLKNTIENDNTLYRLSSDEFVIILPENSDIDKEELASKIIDSLQMKKFKVGEFLIHLSCTIGITEKHGANSTESALVKAHAAMKEARQSGTNRFLTYTPESLFIKKQKETIEWMLKVRDAINNDAIIPYFQPIIDNATHQVVKYECLARLIDNGTVITPFYFIEPARLAGLLPNITKVIATKSFEYFQNKPYDFSINITEEDLREKTLPPLLKMLSEHYRIAPERVTLEILENISAHENEASIEQLSELKKEGYKIALDDFGSEKSNFLRLQKMNVDYLKIDGSFIRDIHENPNSLNICKTIVHLAQSLNCRIIAEFVHSKEVYEVVKAIGIPYSQGYYFGMPVETIDARSE